MIEASKIYIKINKKLDFTEIMKSKLIKNGVIAMANLWQNDKFKLRPVKIEDLDDFYNVEKDFDTDIQRLCDEVHFPMSMDKVKEHVEKLANYDFDSHERTWIIETLDGQVVGNINTFFCDKRNGRFYYGVGIKTEHQRKGFAKSSIKMLLEYFFNELRYNKANAYIYEFNEVSIKLHEKLGFKCEGRQRQMIYTNGKFFDVFCYGLTKDEFNEINI